MRKKLILGIALLIVISLFWFAKHYRSGNHLKSVGYISCFKRHKGYYYQSFKKKIRCAPPRWMQEQMNRDLSAQKISLKALEATQQAIAKRNIIPTNRYRIVNQRLYRYFDPTLAQIQDRWNDEERAPITWFEDGIKTLLELTPLPNLDFIVTHEDGTKEPFYLVESPELQAPVLGWAKLKSTPFLILIPDWRSLSFWWNDDIRKLNEGKSFQRAPVPWEEKKDIAFWRGALTEAIHRLKISSFSLEFPALVDAGISAGLDSSDPHWKPSASYEEHLQYKYLPVLDGIMCSYPGYQWRLLSDSVCFKQESDQIQWFYGALNPYEHYVPIQNDLSNLIDQIIWAQTHDDQCKQIALNATDFALKNLMFDDIYCYLYHVLVSYSRLQDVDLKKDWNVTCFSPHWVCISKTKN